MGTHKRDNDHGIQESHLTFCYIVGGVLGILSPCLAVFFDKCTSEENHNYFYKRNILLANIFKIMIFLVLILQLNFAPQGITSIEGEGNLWKRNVLFSCHEYSLLEQRYPKEFSLPAGMEFKFHWVLVPLTLTLGAASTLLALFCP